MSRLYKYFRGELSGFFRYGADVWIARKMVFDSKTEGNFRVSQLSEKNYFDKKEPADSKVSEQQDSAIQNTTDQRRAQDRTGDRTGGSILPIYITGHPVLHRPAKPITDFSGIHGIVKDMFATMFAAPGVGIAGPQIGLDMRIFVYSYTEDGVLYQGVAINPDLTITKEAEPNQPESRQAAQDESLHGESIINEQGKTYSINSEPNKNTESEPNQEGCLSFPGYQFPLARASHVILRAFDEHRKPFTVHAQGWLARIFQHEFDHLQGTLYIDRLNPKYSEEVRQIVAENNWGVPDKFWIPQKSKE